jgi:Zn-dependent peptidase ImmA (M78 family)/transcriptional regulator with XRE-family HTH domain
MRLQPDKFKAMETASLTHNLRRLRDEKGLSQTDVAERAGISRVAYRNIETGDAAPRASTLARIAEVLGVRISGLMEEVKQLQAVRFRDKGMISREQLLVRVGRWLEGYSELEQLLKPPHDFTFRKALSGVRKQAPGAARAGEVAIAARRSVKLGSGALIRDICGLLEDNGVKVFPISLASDGFFGLSVAEADGGPAVVVNVWDRISVERWIFTAAHELGHLLLHLDAYNVEKRAEDRSEENEADMFASYFLMPNEVFESEWHEARGLSFVERVLKLKRMFHVSYKTVLYRLSETTSLGGSVWGRFQAEYKAAHGRTLSVVDEPEGLTAGDFRSPMAESRSADEPAHLSSYDFAEDRLRRLVRDGLEKKLITIGRGAEILGLTLTEMRKLVAGWVA